MNISKFIKALPSVLVILFLSACSEDDSSSSVQPTATPTVMINEDIQLETYFVTNIISRSAKSGGIILDDGGNFITEKGVCWSKEPDPTIEDFKTNDGEGVGSFESVLQILEPETKYFYRAYAINSKGVNYGNQSSFTTNEIRRPIIRTLEPWAIRINTAYAGADSIDDNGLGITRKGICWSTEQNPNVEDFVKEAGTGSESFFVELTGLSTETKYYVRSFAVNIDGITYGEEYSFTTYPNIPLPEYHISYSGDYSATITKESYSFYFEDWDSTYVFRLSEPNGSPDINFRLSLKELETGTYTVNNNSASSANLNLYWAWNSEINYRMDNGQITIEEFDLYYKIEFDGRLYNANSNLIIQLNEGRIIHWK